MTQKPPRYKLSYLPLFWEDLSAAATYIAHDLHNPSAAKRLVDDVEKGIFAHLQNPTTAATYHTTRKRPLPYYYFGVGNYRVFYVVDGNTMEVRRMLYRARNIEELIR